MFTKTEINNKGMDKKKLEDLIEEAWIEILLIKKDGKRWETRMTMNPLVALNIHVGDKLAFNKNEFENVWNDFLHENGHKVLMNKYLQSLDYPICFIQITDRIFHFGKRIELQAKVVPVDGVFYINDNFNKEESAYEYLL